MSDVGQIEPAAGPWKVVLVAQLVRLLCPQEGAPAGRPWILAVDGRSGSGELLIVEGAGAARRELMHLLDAVVWVQSDATEAERRGIERDGGDEPARSFWQLWMAEERPFMARQRPWTRANVIVAGVRRASLMIERTKWSSPELAVDLLGCLPRPATAPEGFGACQERTGEKWLTDERTVTSSVGTSRR